MSVAPVIQEPEVELKKFDCPYDAKDPRSLAYIEGYHAGLHRGHEIATKAIVDEAREHFGPGRMA